jgi:hypothetical protein
MVSVFHRISSPTASCAPLGSFDGGGLLPLGESKIWKLAVSAPDSGAPPIAVVAKEDQSGCEKELDLSSLLRCLTKF